MGADRHNMDHIGTFLLERCTINRQPVLGNGSAIMEHLIHLHLLNL